MLTNPDHQREQARVRQTRHRRRACADRIELQAAVEAAKLPLAWHPEFLDLVRRERDRAEKALAVVERTAMAFSEGTARAAYLKSNYKHTKVSVPRLLKEFEKRKRSLAYVEIDRNAEYDDYDGYRPLISPTQRRSNGLTFRRSR